MTRLLKLFTFAFVLTHLPVSASHAEDATAGLTAVQKKEVNTLIESYIKDNPEAIMNALEQFQIDQRAKAENEAAEKLTDHITYLTSQDVPHAGNKDGDVKVVEFFDYNCGYCKRAFQDLQILLEADDKVEVFFVEMPILGDSSTLAAQWSLAAMKLDANKYFKFHSALMKFAGQKDEEALKTLAETAGYDATALAEAAKDKAIDDTIQKNINIARELGIGGTPGFIVGEQIFRGYIGYDGLKATIDEIRNTAASPAEDTKDEE